MSVHLIVFSELQAVKKNMDCSGQWKPVVSMVTVSFALALVNISMKKIVDEGMNHMIVVTYRQAFSTVFLTPIAYFWERKNRPKLTACILCQLFFSALIGVTLTQYFFLLGLEYTSATFSCAFANLVPAITFILALPFGLEKVNVRDKAGKAKVVGTLICVAGAMLLTLYKGKPLHGSLHSGATVHLVSHPNMMVPNKKAERWALGSLLLTAGCCFWSSWFLLQARIGKSYPRQYSSTAFLSLFSLIQSGFLGFISEKNLSKWVIKGTLDILSVTYVGVVGAGLCYVGMSWCVKKKGPLFTAAFTPLMQIFAAIFDFSLLHGQIYFGSVIGSILVAVGLYILLWGRSMEASETLVKQPQPLVVEGDELCNSRSQV